MSAPAPHVAYYTALCRYISYGEVAVALLTRLTIAEVFVVAGYGKLMHLQNVINFFRTLHIPYPQIEAPVASFFEFFCGLLLLIGFATRLAVLPLIVIMIVAICADPDNYAKAQQVGDLVSLPEYLYIVLLAWLGVRGAGRISVDGIISTLRTRATPTP